ADSSSRHRPRVGVVSPIKVVHPALVAARIDGCTARCCAQKSISTGLINPGWLDLLALCFNFPAADGVTESPRVRPTRRREDELRTIARGVDIAHAGINRVADAGGSQSISLPVRAQLRRRTSHSDHRDLTTLGSVGLTEVADNSHRVALRCHSNGLRPDARPCLSWTARVVVIFCEVNLQKIIMRSCHRVQRDKPAVIVTCHSFKNAAHIEAIADQLEVVNCTVHSRGCEAGSEIPAYY